MEGLTGICWIYLCVFSFGMVSTGKKKDERTSGENKYLTSFSLDPMGCCYLGVAPPCPSFPFPSTIPPDCHIAEGACVSVHYLACSSPGLLALTACSLCDCRVWLTFSAGSFCSLGWGCSVSDPWRVCLTLGTGSAASTFMDSRRESVSCPVE